AAPEVPGALQSSARASGILALSPNAVCYRPQGRERAHVINVITEDRKGVLWCGTENGLFRLEKSNERWVLSEVEIGLPLMPHNASTISTMLVDRNGTLWIGAGSGLYRYETEGRAERYTTAQGLPNNDVRALLEDRDGRLWAGTTKGLSQIDPHAAPGAPIVTTTYTVKTGLSNDYIVVLYQSEDGNIWLGSDSGLTQFDPLASDDKKRFRNYTTSNGMSGNEIKSIGEDRDGNLWIGTETDGVMKLARHGFASYTETDGLQNTRIASIFEDATGQLCIVSSRAGGFIVHRLQGNKLIAIRSKLPEDIPRSWGWNQLAFQDHTEEWWVDTAAGLYRFPKAHSVENLDKLRPAMVYTTKDGLSGNEIFRLYEDSHGDIWISIADSLQANLTRWERSSGKFYQYGANELLATPNAPTAFREDKAGNLWIGFYYGGLVRYRDGQFNRFTSTDGLPPGLVSDLYCDQSGKLWIATTRGGIAVVDDPSSDHPRFKTYTTREGLASNQAMCITEDQHGRLYIGTGRGINRLDPLTGAVKHYSEADGLARDFINVAYRDHQGTLWFGTLQGLSRMIPEEDRPVSPPTILISKVRIAGVEQALRNLNSDNGPSLVLEANRNQVQIDFVAPSFGVGETLRYQTWLEGADETWSEPSVQRTVNYAQLASGTYRFLVRAVRNDGTASLQPATISFRILPPVWQRWWFTTVLALIALASIYFLYRYRVNRLLELERVRTRIATDLHDDIGSSLSRMAILSEVLKRDEAAVPNLVGERLTDIAETSRGLVDTMSDIVWSIDPRRDELRNVIQRVRQFAADVLEARGIRWKLESPPELDHLKLPPEQRRHLFLILKEAINNVARHSGSTNVSLTIKVSGDQLCAEIRDDGIGFSPVSSAVRGNGSGHGLANMRARAVELGGSLEIDSIQGVGSKIILIVPLRRKHGMNMLFSRWWK
ncbi:MAG TPA: two-component regulator propeller domain-containing protein, partial [Pyrinomonadaceae bacterium]